MASSTGRHAQPACARAEPGALPRTSNPQAHFESELRTLSEPRDAQGSEGARLCTSATSAGLRHARRNLAHRCDQYTITRLYKVSSCSNGGRDMGASRQMPRCGGQSNSDRGWRACAWRFRSATIARLGCSGNEPYATFTCEGSPSCDEHRATRDDLSGTCALEPRAVMI